jgi:hypothetical protein
MAVTVAYVDIATAELQGLQLFQIGARVHTHSGPCPVGIVVFTHAITVVFEFMKGGWGRRVIF